MKAHLRILVPAAATLLLALAGVEPGWAVVPDQFIAKIYTEGLGRLPDQPGWTGRVNYFSSNGCNKASLKASGRDLYLSTEYANLGYDNLARLLTLYRGVLNREPDSAYTFWLGQLNGGASWATVVDAFFDSSEFNTLVASICSSSATSYNWGTHPVLNLPVTTTGFQGGTGAQLQAVLNSTPSGGTVFLAQKSVTRLTSTLNIPPGVTLTTTGQPLTTRYALMGRLVRESGFNAEAVKLNSGSKLRSVWVDGRRNTPSNFTMDAINVRMHGGTNSVVENCRMDNSRGWATLQSVGWSYVCGGHTIRRNLVTAYSSGHTGGLWTDGLSISCENALVEENEVVDATDVPIVLFRAPDGAVQRSTVRNNIILNAGTSAYGGLAVDPLTSTSGGVIRDFTGASVTNNLMWTGGRVHWDIGIAVGTRAWFGTVADTGLGVTVTGNSTGTVRSRADLGIGISRVANVTVLSNNLLLTHVNSSACPGGSGALSIIAAVAAGHASGTIQLPYTDAVINQCIGH